MGWGPSFLQRRLLAEARLTDRLQHARVAPVHAVGRLEHGLPLLRMKLVTKRTLGELLRARCASKGPC